MLPTLIQHLPCLLCSLNACNLDSTRAHWPNAAPCFDDIGPTLHRELSFSVLTKVNVAITNGSHEWVESMPQAGCYSHGVSSGLRIPTHDDIAQEADSDETSNEPDMEYCCRRSTHHLL